MAQESPPVWLLEYIEHEVSSQVDLTSGDLLPPDEDWVTTALRGVPEGERDNTAIKLAGYYLGRGEPESRVLEMLRSWNLRNPESLPDKDLCKVVTSAARMEARKRIRTGAQEGKAESGPNGALPWEEQRQASLQGLGERLGLPITDIRVTKSDDSIFEFFLGEDDSVMVTAGDLIEQRLFRKRFASAGLLAPKRITEPKGGGAWDEVFRQMVRLAILQDVGQGSSTLGELREFLNDYVETYRGLSYFSSNQSIPNHVAFFIVQRKGEKPKLYARVFEIFMEARARLGLKTLKKLTILLPSLEHKSEKFTWNRQTVRAWCMNLDSMSQEIKEMVFKKAAEGKDRE